MRTACRAPICRSKYITTMKYIIGNFEFELVFQIIWPNGKNMQPSGFYLFNLPALAFWPCFSKI